MSSKPGSPSSDPLRSVELFFLLGMAFQLVLGEFMRRLGEAGYQELRPIHGLVFQALIDGGLTSTELAERIGVTKQASGQIVDHLAQLGYVERRPHPDRGRRRLVVLTDKASAHLRVAGDLLHDFEREIGAALGPAELTRLRSDLRRVIRELAGDELPALRPAW